MRRSSLLVCALSFSIYAQSTQTLPGDSPDLKFEDNTGDSPYLPGSGSAPQFKSDQKSYALPGGGTDLTFEDDMISNGQTLPNDGPQPLSVVTVRKKEILNQVRSRGRTTFGLNYLYNTFKYEDSLNVFEEVFGDAHPGNHRFGMLQFSASRFFTRKLIDFYWKVNLGISYNRGRGRFESGEGSNMHFQVWDVPLDLLVGVDVPLGWSTVMVGIAAGPSIMGLIQSRDDYGTNESGRRKRQYSFGYAYQLKASIDLSSILTSMAYKLYDDFSVSRCYMNLVARGHSYSGFQDSDIAISGISFGLGFTFEYL